MGIQAGATTITAAATATNTNQTKYTESLNKCAHMTPNTRDLISFNPNHLANFLPNFKLRYCRCHLKFFVFFCFCFVKSRSTLTRTYIKKQCKEFRKKFFCSVNFIPYFEDFFLFIFIFLLMYLAVSVFLFYLMKFYSVAF